MPYTVSFVHKHVVHLYRKPDIHSVVPLAVINVLVDWERIGSETIIFNKIGTRIGYCTEITLSIIIAVIEYTPLLNGRLQHKRMAAVGVYAENLGFG